MLTISYNWSVDENRAVPIPHSSSSPEFNCSTNFSFCSVASRPSCYHYKFILNHLHFKMLGFSAVMHLQCHMWARLHFKVHPSSSFRIVGQSSHFSANTSCSVKLTCHLNSFIPRPLN